MIQENKFRGTNERGGGILQRGAHRKHTYAKNIYGRGRRSLSALTTRKFVVGFGPKRTSPSSLISSPDLALAHHLLCLLPLPPLRLHRRLPGTETRRTSAPPRVSAPQLLPAPTNPPNSRAPPGHFRRKFVPKLRFFFFFALLLSLPRPPPPPFSFLTPPRSAPLLLLRLIVFSHRKARVFDGGDRGFASGGVDLVPRCGFFFLPPNFACVCVCVRADFRFGFSRCSICSGGEGIMDLGRFL